ncbi:hypothetical protein WN51_06518 [Melipona quadrifasciata]|uniref:Uncharacterized protein n=1 Tax=Melipona quadrifasciata TaxID=166423 RepID=A0A0M8ZT73_9HYME|nr:hypothetical protein WN51_06518 [Melipona quadrifasciata]
MVVVWVWKTIVIRVISIFHPFVPFWYLFDLIDFAMRRNKPAERDDTLNDTLEKEKLPRRAARLLGIQAGRRITAFANDTTHEF